MTSKVAGVLEQLTNNKFLAAAVLASILGGVSLKADVSVLQARYQQVETDRRQDKADISQILQAIARLESGQRSTESALADLRIDIRRLLERK